MPQPQSAICAEGGDHGLFITALVSAGQEETVRRTAAALPALTRAVAKEFEEPALVSSIAFGAEVWPRLFSQGKPEGLVAFAPLEANGKAAPATPADLFIHIHSNRSDANFQLGRRVVAMLGGAVTLVEDIAGFRTLGGRDLTGFVDGTENPEGEERAEVALDETGGSFVSLQRWEHDLARWEALAVKMQEAAIGRTKADDREMDDDEKPADAHIARVVIEENGEELAILRHSLPYGDMRRNGLYFVAYGRSPKPFRRMLSSMVLGDGASKGYHNADRIMEYTRPVTGCAFYAPSVETLENLVKSR
ncbi:MAG TPA: Dyp-type peroxidase [Candidatus Sulfotelmatobacter sp.]|jgi:putative iron-dependent peroxidase|nr:Dyp-type peroxidase [Candidatus Sulfotelmatobacter sp.]